MTYKPIYDGLIDFVSYLRTNASIREMNEIGKISTKMKCILNFNNNVIRTASFVEPKFQTFFSTIRASIAIKW